MKTIVQLNLEVRTASLEARESALARQVADLSAREESLANKEKSVGEVRTLLSLERTKVKAGLDRETALAAKLEECRRLLGAKSAQLTKIGMAFPNLIEA